MLHAVCFDLYETLFTEFDPHWTSGPGIEARLGLDAETFTQEWRQRREMRMRGHLDFEATLHDICRAAGHRADPGVVHALHQERLAHKRKPFEAIDTQIL